MPSSKNQLQRIAIINSCLSGQKKYWTRTELMEKIEDSDIRISDRTFNADLDLMRNDPRLAFYAPIAYCSHHRAYYYTDPEYSIFSFKITPELEQSVLLAQHLAEQCGEDHLFRIIEPILKAMSRFIHASMPRKNEGNPFVKFQTASRGGRFFDRVAEAIRTTKVLALQVGVFVNKSRQHILHPYLLKEMNHEWFVIGYAEKLKRRVAVRLAALRTIEEVDKPFFEDGREDLQKEDDVFDHLIC